MDIIVEEVSYRSELIPSYQYIFVFSNSNNPTKFIVHSNEFLEYSRDKLIPIDEFFEFYKNQLNVCNGLKTKTNSRI